MQTKTFEVRDRMTFIPCLAVCIDPFRDSLTEADRYLLRRCGYAADVSPSILFMRLDGSGEVRSDPYGWGSSSRTMGIAHQYVTRMFDALQSGDVIDVEFVLGEKDTPKTSERLS